MLSNVISENTQQEHVSESDLIVSVLISNYPLSNGGYLVSFGKNESDGSFKNFDPIQSVFYECSVISGILNNSSVFLPKGCFYLPELALADFIRFLSSGASFFDMKLLPASGNLQGLLLIKVDEDSLFRYEQKEED